MRAIKKKSIKIIISVAMAITVFGCNNAFAAESTLAEFNYDASGKVSGEKLTEYGDKDGYTSTAGNGNLLCYMATDSSRALEWSDPEYNNDGVNIVPIVRASSKNTWGSVPSFAVSVSTKGFTQIKFSAKMAGSSNGPSTWKLQYSIDGTNYTDIAGSQIEIQFDTRKNMINYYNEFSLPEAVADKDIVYIRIIAASEKTVIGGNYLNIPWGGETSINNISVRGTDISSIQTTTAAPEPTTTKPDVQPATSPKPTETENNITKKNEQTTKVANERKTTSSGAYGSNKNTETTGASGNKNQSVTNVTDNNGTSQNSKSDSSHAASTHIVTETNAAGETITSVVYDETQEETTASDEKDSKKGSKKTIDSKNKKDKDKISTSGEVEKTSSKAETKSSETIIIVVLVIVLAAGLGAAVIFQKRNKG